MKKAFGFFSESNSDESIGSAEHDSLRVGIAFLLAAAARSDGALGAEEHALLSKILVHKLNLPASRVERLLHTEASPELDFALKEAVAHMAESFSVEQREKILALIVAIITADSIIDDDEAAFAAHVRVALGLSLEQGVRARKRAESIEMDGFAEFVKTWQGMQEPDGD